MSKSLAEVFTAISGASAVVAIVGTRCFLEGQPLTAAVMPCVTYGMLANDDVLFADDAACGTVLEIQVDCWSTGTANQTLAAAVKAALLAAGGMQFKELILRGENPELYHIMQWYRFENIQ